MQSEQRNSLRLAAASAGDPKKIQEDAAPEQVPQAEASAPPQRAAPVKTSEELDKQIHTLIRALAARSQQRSAQKDLVKIGPAAVPALAEALKDKDARVRFSTGRALGEIGPAAKAAVPALIQALKDEDGSVRYQTVLALGKIGPAAKAAVPALKEALEDRGLSRHAAEALGKIEGR